MVPRGLPLIRIRLRGVDTGLSFDPFELRASSLELPAVRGWLQDCCLLLLAGRGGLPAARLELLAVGFLLLAWLPELLFGGALVWAGWTSLRVLGTGVGGMHTGLCVALNGPSANFFREFSVSFRLSCLKWIGTYII